jgi:hypothetical protein
MFFFLLFFFVFCLFVILFLLLFLFLFSFRRPLFSFSPLSHSRSPYSSQRPCARLYFARLDRGDAHTRDDAIPRGSWLGCLVARAHAPSARIVGKDPSHGSRLHEFYLHGVEASARQVGANIFLAANFAFILRPRGSVASLTARGINCKT